MSVIDHRQAFQREQVENFESGQTKVLSELEAARLRLIRLLHLNIEGEWPADDLDLEAYYARVKQELGLC